MVITEICEFLIQIGDGHFDSFLGANSFDLTPKKELSLSTLYSKRIICEPLFYHNFAKLIGLAFEFFS